MLSRVCVLSVVAWFCAAGQNSKPAVSGSSTASTSPRTAEVDVSASQQWLDTGVDIGAGDSVFITATGTLKYGASPSGPGGLARGWRDLLRVLPVSDLNRGALAGRIGSSDTARPFLIGPQREMVAQRAGRLFVCVNQASNDYSEGSYHVSIRVTPGAPKTDRTKGVKLAVITQELLDSLPRRVGDAEGNPGDTVNFLVVGSEQKMLAAFDAAGWVKVDKSPKDAVMHGVLASISKQAYTQLPMSELMLFGRSQDYGMAHAEPFSVVATRHHFRIWKAPQPVDGQTLWVGAGTHDIGFDKDQRNGKLTHKIDPDIDLERKFISGSLEDTGSVLKTDYMTPSKAVTTARTAHGEDYHSDGRTVVIWLEPDSAADAILPARFGDVFCTVLAKENPDGGDWKDCGQYLTVDKPNKDATLPDMPKNYRVLVVPGIMNSCASAAPAFEEGRVHLKDKHDLTMELLAVPNDSSESNAGLIASYIQEQTRTDPRKYILIGYSKGAPDIQTMLATNSAAAAKVAAFIAVAGASGGSPIADILPAQMDVWIKKFNMGPCKGDLSQGFKSLQRDVRSAFLARYPTLPVPVFSLPATSDASNTSKMLLENLKMMQVFAAENDSQLTKADATLPGSRYLGTARADHFAVALPLEKMQNGALKALVDKGTYPRAALLETLLRVVGQELGNASRAVPAPEPEKPVFDLRP